MAADEINPLTDAERRQCLWMIDELQVLSETGVFNDGFGSNPIYKASVTYAVILLNDLLQKMRKDGHRYRKPPTLDQPLAFEDVTHLIKDFRNTLCHIDSSFVIDDGEAQISWSFAGPSPPGSFASIAGRVIPRVPEGDVSVGYGNISIAWNGDFVAAEAAVRKWLWEAMPDEFGVPI